MHAPPFREPAPSANPPLPRTRPCLHNSSGLYLYLCSSLDAGVYLHDVMGVYVLKQHTPAQLATLQRRVVDTIIAGKPPHGFNMRAFHSQPPKGSELDWFVGRHLDYHMRAADRGDLLTGGPMQRLRRVRLRAEGEVAAAGEGEYFLARESTVEGVPALMPDSAKLLAAEGARGTAGGSEWNDLRMTSAAVTGSVLAVDEAAVRSTCDQP